MTETPDTTTEPENPDAEPETPIEGDDADAEEHEEEQTPAQAGDAEGSAEVAKKLTRENERHLKAVSKLLDVDMEPFACPTCDGFGFTPDGLGDQGDLVMDDTLEVCPKCNGRGERGTPSLVPEYRSTICLPCTGRGYVTKQIIPENIYKIPTPAPITGPQAQMGTMMPDGTFVPFGAPPQPTVNAWTT